jgi:hypothetical protein
VALILKAIEDRSFRVIVAVWAGDQEKEIVFRAERLEALLAMWDGAPITEAAWTESHAFARKYALSLLKAMQERADVEERAALRRQLEAARRRLLGELARFLACAATGNEDFDSAFHRMMLRGGQLGALLVRAHGLVGYPIWPSSLVQNATEMADRLGANQRVNVLLGTPLEAAVSDPDGGRPSLSTRSPRISDVRRSTIDYV